ncbi:MAG: hypothetical protein LBV53_01085 [Mycoplasmataceae bacterium]|nr:hypothetical protein [Mycoplasmataceae bacterium]
MTNCYNINLNFIAKLKESLIDITIEYLRTGDNELKEKRIHEFEAKHFKYTDEDGLYPDSYGIDDLAYYHIYKRPLTELNSNERNRLLLDIKEESEYSAYEKEKSIEITDINNTIIMKIIW